MVLPINPGNFPLDQPDNSQVPAEVSAPLQNQHYTPRQTSPFPGLPPSGDYVPKLFLPRRMTLQNYSLIIGKAISSLKQMLFYGKIVDEMITLRFYRGSVIGSRTLLNGSSTIAANTLNAQVNDIAKGSDTNEGIYGSIANLNRAIETHILGPNQSAIQEEYSTIDHLNQEIQNYKALSNPTPEDISRLNVLITNFNLYASKRNDAIKSYNLAVDQYNSEVGEALIGEDGSVNYPSGTINKTLLGFNTKYEGTEELTLTPLTFFPQLSHRDLLPQALPPVDLNHEPSTIPNPRFSLILAPFNEAATSSDEIISIDKFPDFSLISSPPGQILSDSFTEINSYFNEINEMIAAYNVNQIGDQISPEVGTENKAIMDLNLAISQWNDLSNRTQSDLIVLQNAITNYQTASYGGSGFSPKSPRSGSLNDRINRLNQSISEFNAASDSPPAVNLMNLNNQIGMNNQARNYFNLPPIPEYSQKSLRRLMPDAPSIPIGLNISELSTFSQLPLRESYDRIPLISESTLESSYLFSQSVNIGDKLHDSLFLTFEQTSDADFLGYESLLKGEESIPSRYNHAIHSYMNSSQVNLGGMPAIAGSDGFVALDPKTQQIVIQDLLNAINQVPSLDAAELQQKINEYNSYASLVNTTVIANTNQMIDHINSKLIGNADPKTGEYPSGTLNSYAQAFNTKYRDKGLVGPLKISTALPEIEAMPMNLPPVTTLVTVAGHAQPLYELGKFLNSTVNAKVPAMNALNATIDVYNKRVGDLVAPDSDTENGRILALNDAIQGAFPRNVASKNPAVDPNVYFTAIDNLNNSILSYNANLNALDIEVNSLNGQLVAFNATSLSTVNAEVNPLLKDINRALKPFSFSPLETLNPLVEREEMPEYQSLPYLIPGAQNLLAARQPYPSVQFRLELPNRAVPQELPPYFSLFGQQNDLTAFNRDDYEPTIAAIQEYNTASNGVAYENQAIDQLNSAINRFNSGEITSTELKQAISSYVQQISTEDPNVNQKIRTLNHQIQGYRNELTGVNHSLSYWGSMQIPSDYNIKIRKMMPPAPLPDVGEDQSYATGDYGSFVEPLRNRTLQNFPKEIAAPSLAGTQADVQPVELSSKSMLTIAAEGGLIAGMVQRRKEFLNLKRILDHLNSIVDLQAFLEGRRIQFSNSYIEMHRAARYPASTPIGVALASISTGYNSHHFEALITNDLFRSLNDRFISKKALGLNNVFQILSLELLNKVASRTFLPSFVKLGGRPLFASIRSFKEANGEPIVPIVALEFLDQLSGLIPTDVISKEIGHVLGPYASPVTIEAYSSALKISLILNGLQILGFAFGRGVPGKIVSLVPSLASNTHFTETKFPEKPVLNVPEKPVFNVSVKPNFTDASIVHDINNKNILNSQILNSRIKSNIISNGVLRDALEKARESQLRNTLSSSEQAVLDTIQQNIENQNILESQIEDSIIQDNILKYEQNRQAIRDQIVKDSVLSDAEIASQNAQALVDQINDEAIEQDIIDARDLSQRTLQELIDRDALMSELDQKSILNDLIKQEIIRDNEQQDAINKRKIAELQQNFDVLQNSLRAREALSQSLQKTFNLQPSQADIIAQEANISAPNLAISPLDVPELNFAISEQNFKNLLLEKVHDSLNKLDDTQRNLAEQQLRRVVLDGVHSLRNLLDQNIQHLQDLNDRKIDRELANEFQKRFASINEPSVFLLNLLDPLYFGIYSIESGLMYDKPKKSDYKRDIEIQV